MSTVKKDRFALGDSMSFVLVVPDGEELPEMEGFTSVQEDDMGDRIKRDADISGLRIEQTDDGFGVFEDEIEAPLCIENVTWFDSASAANDALIKFAEFRDRQRRRAETRETQEIADDDTAKVSDVLGTSEGDQA